MRNSRIFLFIFATMIFLTTCGDDQVGPDPMENNLPANLTILEPSAASTYWTDEAVPCLHDATKYNDQTEWKAGGAVVSCTDGKLDTELSAGKHTITATIKEGSESVSSEIEITVKVAFSVTLISPEDGAEYFVGDKVACQATVEPASYESSLEITVGGQACVDGTAEIGETGEVGVVASVTESGRTESQEVTVFARPVVAGTVYPLTDQGVSGSAGNFTVTLKADGEVLDVKTSNDGFFAIKSEHISQLGSEEVTLEVAANDNFYGAKAVLPASELQALVEAGELGFVLAPRTWTIRDGELAGESTNLKLREAFTRYDPEDHVSSFYKLTKIFGKHKYISIFSEEIPIPTAFNRADSEVAITASDSTEFWRQTDDVTEPYVGRGDLFAPVTIAEVPSIEDGIRVQILADGKRSSASSIPGDSGYIVGGWMKLAIHNLGSHTQTHEQGHNLGFGHTNVWAGIMTYGSAGNFNQTTKPTIIDVAHMQVYIDTFDLQFKENISFGVLEWMQALDIKGLPETTSSAQ